VTEVNGSVVVNEALGLMVGRFDGIAELIGALGRVDGTALVGVVGVFYLARTDACYRVLGWEVCVW
jgi:hypothetical protein